jgi:hypothetical protein
MKKRERIKKVSKVYVLTYTTNKNFNDLLIKKEQKVIHYCNK